MAEGQEADLLHGGKGYASGIDSQSRPSQSLCWASWRKRSVAGSTQHGGDESKTPTFSRKNVFSRAALLLKMLRVLASASRNSLVVDFALTRERRAIALRLFTDSPGRFFLGTAHPVQEWQGHSPEALKTMKDHLARLKQLGVEAVDD